MTLFEPGRIVTTPGIAELFDRWRTDTDSSPKAAHARLIGFVLLHLGGHWGDVDHHDAAANTNAVRNGHRIMSAYTFHGQRIWIITEADRTVTTALLPSEY